MHVLNSIRRKNFLLRAISCHRRFYAFSRQGGGLLMTIDVLFSKAIQCSRYDIWLFWLFWSCISPVSWIRVSLLPIKSAHESSFLHPWQFPLAPKCMSSSLLIGRITGWPSNAASGRPNRWCLVGDYFGCRFKEVAYIGNHRIYLLISGICRDSMTSLEHVDSLACRNVIFASVG